MITVDRSLPPILRRKIWRTKRRRRSLDPRWCSTIRTRKRLKRSRISSTQVAFSRANLFQCIFSLYNKGQTATFCVFPCSSDGKCILLEQATRLWNREDERLSRGREHFWYRRHFQAFFGTILKTFYQLFFVVILFSFQTFSVKHKKDFYHEGHAGSAHCCVCVVWTNINMTTIFSPAYKQLYMNNAYVKKWYSMIF